MSNHPTDPSQTDDGLHSDLEQITRHKHMNTLIKPSGDVEEEPPVNFAPLKALQMAVERQARASVDNQLRDLRESIRQLVGTRDPNTGMIVVPRDTILRMIDKQLNQ